MINKTASLMPNVIAIVDKKATEAPFSGSYQHSTGAGSYLCRRCGLALFKASAQFHSGCGWPSFDQEIPHAIAKEPDKDGMRTEILCARCRAHLGHIFFGENFTVHNTRYCVNSLSLEWIPYTDVTDTEEAIFAAGCFWGVEYYFKQLAGVVKTEVGYSGGNHAQPTYAQVCNGTTGHYEAIRVLYDPTQLTYEALVKYFFEIHNSQQHNGQGPDIGQQYQSAIFYFNEEQQQIAHQILNLLPQYHIHPTTQLLPVSIFWPAEDYHQNYYEKQKKIPYCHQYQKIFKN